MVLVAGDRQIPGQQFLDSIDEMVGDPGEDFAQVSFLCSARDQLLSMT